MVTSTDGVRVAVHDHGGPGPAVLFLHATGFHGRCWDPVIAALTSDVRAIAIDLRGHGDSEMPDGTEIAWPAFADDVLAVVDALELGGGLLAAGHSMGGATIVLTELARPGTFARAFGFEPILVPESPGIFTGDSNPIAEGARRRREVFDSHDAVFERYSSRPPFSMVDPTALRCYIDHGFRPQEDGTVILKCRGEVEASVFDSSRTGVFDRLDGVATEYTVVGGGDGGPPARIARPAAEALPNGRFIAADDLTHFGPLEDPTRVAGWIEEALGLTRP